MSHQPFETWLFEEPSLDESEAEALRQHLAVCGACQPLAEAWNELGDLLRSPGLAAPTTGFAGRWRARLAVDREQRRRRQAWWALGLTTGGGLGVTVALGLQIASLLRSPAMLALRFAQSLSAFLAQLFLLREAIASLAEDVPPLLTSAWALVFLGILALLAGAWALFIYRYAFQGVRK